MMVRKAESEWKRMLVYNKFRDFWIDGCELTGDGNWCWRCACDTTKQSIYFVDVPHLVGKRFHPIRLEEKNLNPTRRSQPTSRKNSRVPNAESRDILWSQVPAPDCR